MTLTKTFTTCLILSSVAFALSFIFQFHPPDQINGFADARVLEVRPQSNTSTFDGSFQPHDISEDRLLHGLLSPGFDKDSCLSRYQAALYRKSSPFKSSSYLRSKLRNYEQLHKRCGPHTESYNKTLQQLHAASADTMDCKYVVWISYSGLGNRILTLASSFLYALLTDRVLLVDRGKDIDDLFCEPFPDTSWLLPLDFPLTNEFNGVDQKSAQCYGNMLKNNLINETLPPYMYHYLAHDYGYHDKMFFCDEDQAVIGKVPWLIMKTNNYFVPSLFLMPSFEDELSKLFPVKATAFHHLGRYLFHPTNPVWGLITRYYQAYLAGADERIGIQVRVFAEGNGPFQHVIDQILSCTQTEKILPEIDSREESDDIVRSENPKLKAILVTSLSSGYSEILKNMFFEHATLNGDVIGVYQPSHEEYQQTEKHRHNRKAWAEMYLLSLTDSLVTSAWSTFGYVAQGLGGLKPWILYKPDNGIVPDPPCVRAMSMEPCFHAPPLFDCKTKTGADTGKVVPHVRHCEDMTWGLKVVDSHDEL